MSIGQSGRIVIEVDKETKQQLYSVLKREGLSLKEWFLKNVDSYLDVKEQLPLNIEPKAGELGVKL
jgi:hypothetical protein